MPHQGPHDCSKAHPSISPRHSYIWISIQCWPVTSSSVLWCWLASSPPDLQSTSGFCVFLGLNPVSWCAKKQHTVARSSTAAECRCLAHAELIWLCSLFRDLHIALSTVPLICCDNVSAISLAFNPIFHFRIKHIENDYHFARKKVANK